MNLPRLLVRGETLGHGAAKLFLQFPARDGASAKQDKLYTPALLRSRGSVKDVPRRFVKDVMRRKNSARKGGTPWTYAARFLSCPRLSFVDSALLTARRFFVGSADTFFGTLLFFFPSLRSDSWTVSSQTSSIVIRHSLARFSAVPG